MDARAIKANVMRTKALLESALVFRILSCISPLEDDAPTLSMARLHDETLDSGQSLKYPPHKVVVTEKTA